ncbi:MAG: type 4a pilus biogenesis protein PilO [Deltaproteobacteria bacterium]|nr:type 4a pilus biogenesis protein PilO [Deltaproteobacteria bacterium]
MEGAALFEKIEKIKMPIRILILVGTVALLFAGFFFAVYKPKMEDITNTTKTIEELNRKLNRAKIQRKKLPKVRVEKAQVDTQFREALKLLPNTKEIPNLLKKVTELGNDSNLDFRVFRPKRERSKEFYLEVPVAIEVRGTYHNVAVFFDKVGHMERIMNILNVSMRPVAARSTTLVTTCDAVTYRFKGYK